MENIFSMLWVVRWVGGSGKRDTCVISVFFLLRIYSLRFNFNVFIRLLTSKRLTL